MSVSPESFAEASDSWDLSRLYNDLAHVKGTPLTPAEKTRLRGLLLGYSPQQIARELNITSAGLRVELSRTIYQYATVLVGLPRGQVSWQSISRVLEQAGYRRISKQLGSPFCGLDLASAPLTVNQNGEFPDFTLNPNVPGGNMPLSSKFYIERPPIEANCFREILTPGALIRIKAPRQTGKTSLMSRILCHAEQEGCRAFSLSFQLSDRADFQNQTTFLQRFCANVSIQLNLPIRISDYWNDYLGSKMNCRVYFEQYLLPDSDRPLVIGLDEVDRLFQYPDIAIDFFGLLRAWFEESRVREIWQRLRLILVHSTEVEIPMENHQSPFNVGLTVVLKDFRPHQVWELVQRYGLNWTAAQIEQLIQLIGGHPFLAQRLLYHITAKHMTLAALLESAVTDPEIFGDHLRRYRDMLQQDSRLSKAMAMVVASPEPVCLEAAIAFKLHSMGLVHVEAGHVTVRCELYRLYFRDLLLEH